MVQASIWFKQASGSSKHLVQARAAFQRSREWPWTCSNHPFAFAETLTLERGQQEPWQRERTDENQDKK